MEEIDSARRKGKKHPIEEIDWQPALQGSESSPKRNETKRRHARRAVDPLSTMRPGR